MEVQHMRSARQLGQPHPLSRLHDCGSRKSRRSSARSVGSDRHDEALAQARSADADTCSMAQRQLAAVQAELAKTKRLLAAKATPVAATTATAATSGDDGDADAADDTTAVEGGAGTPNLTKLLAAHLALQDLLGESHPQVVDLQRAVNEARAARRAAKPVDVQVREAERLVAKCRKAVATTLADATAAQQLAADAAAAASAASSLAETAQARLQEAESERVALLQRSAAMATGAGPSTANASDALARLAALIPATEAHHPAALADLAAVRLLLAGLGSTPADDAESDAGTDTASLAMDLDDSAIDRMAAFFRPPPSDAVAGQAAAIVIDDDQRFELVRAHAKSKRKELASAMQALRPAAVRKRITK